MAHDPTGWQLFAAADWAGARDVFAATLETSPDDPDALDGLGQSLWWLGDRSSAIARRREAYAAYQRRGECCQAGRVAAYLAGECRIDGQSAEASGWIARARRLLRDIEICPAHGWLAIEEAKRAGDPAAAERHARVALEIAGRLADPDIECMALAQIGRAATRQGRVDEGVSLLDEAMTVALGGEANDPLACGDACCTTLVVCDGLADVQRAAEWCEAVVDFNERRRFVPLQSWCRSIYARVLLRSGDWIRAEAVLLEAVRAVPGRRRNGGRGLPLAVLADLRLRQGRREEAEQLLVDLGDEPAALAPLVELQLQSGDYARALALVDRAVGTVEDETVALLRGSVAIAAADLATASLVATGLKERAGVLDRADLGAAGALLAGRVAHAAGEPACAVAELEDAVARFAALRFPLEEGRARLALAAAESSIGSPLAVASARAARDVFERLGARRDADEAAALLRALGAGGRSATRGDRDDLTAREREVLGLLAAGLSNGEIAERLVIAPKTAEHHVGHILAKLGLRSRTEAATYALREGIGG